MVKLERQNKKVNEKLYKNALKELRTVIEENVPIEHVGSTAIPRMYGKNIIDILVGAETDEEMEMLSNKIIELGYFPGNKRTGYVYRFFASTEEETKAGDIHIHLAKIDTDRYKDFLILRNYLLKNTEERINYSNLKKTILKNGYSIREDYKAIKSEYVSKLLDRAREDYYK